MESRTRGASLFLIALFAGGVALATTKEIPIVTQVQGATFYRTSVTISNGDPVISTPVILTFSYRSPVDGTFQIVTVGLSPALPPRRVVFFDDVIQALKDNGAIRSQDANQGLYGTLLIEFSQILETDKFEAGAVARTYSPAAGGGTLGIAYAGRCFCESGTTGRVVSATRSGGFGNDGSTRSNLGIVNEGFDPTDVQVSYYDGGSGVLLKQFNLSSKAGHVLEENEVYQLNDIFRDSAIPGSTNRLLVELKALTSGVYVSAYGVQLDNVTNDGSFFLFEEE